MVVDARNLQVREKIFNTKKEAIAKLDSMDKSEMKSAKVVAFQFSSGIGGFAIMVDGNKFLRRNGEIR